MTPWVGVISKDGMADANCGWFLFTVKAATTHVAINCRIAVSRKPSGGEVIQIRN